LFIYSCDPIWSGYERLYVNNETNNDFTIYTQFYISEIEIGDTLVNLKKNEKDILISDYFDGGGLIGRPAIRNMKIWIYDVLDSTYYVIYNNERYDPFFNQFKGLININTNIDEENRICLYTVYVNITDSLKSLMSKNTQITDSIFRLKY
jgi:hypothetical protein